MIKPWRTRSSRDVVSDRWLTLRADSCELPNGKVVEPYYVIDRPSWVCIVALTANGDVVLTREFRQGAGLIADGLPGGMIDLDETVEAAAERELAEETGYVCSCWTTISVCYANWKNHTNQLHILLGEGAEQTQDQVLDPGEDIEVILSPWADWLEVVSAEPSQAYYVAASLLVDRWLRARA
jgi:8-oxo-dGTP pyrophosphatase MutT (NUDIX family)